MSAIEITTIERIAEFLSRSPSARNSDVIRHMQVSFGINYQLPQWLYFIDCAKGNI